MARAVEAAENATALQLCVYLGPTEAEPRAHAEAIFIQAGFHQRPGVLILVAPRQRRVEVVTGPLARGRVDDAACARAVTGMTDHFRQGRLVTGIVVGVQQLTAAAGTGSHPEGSEHLPDVIDG